MSVIDKDTLLDAIKKVGITQAYEYALKGSQLVP
jgi:hypothetical protein